MPANSHVFRQMHGIVILNKPAGPSSAQCLVPFKRQGQKKIGHGGTLDPAAAGVLPILLGEATKLASWLQQGGRKIYSGRIRLGVETDSWDMQGRILAEKSAADINPERIHAEVRRWIDLQDQPVPAFSAAKLNGQPLYKMARTGQMIITKTKKIKIYEAGVLSISMPFVDFRVACGSGTYIRSLAHSLGQRLECGAALETLTREFSQPFDLDHSHTLEEISRGLEPGMVLPLPAALPHWPRIPLAGQEAAQVKNGGALPAPEDASGMAFLCQGEQPIAIAEAKTTARGKFWVIVRGLWNI